MKTAWIDFESKSACPISHGAYNYVMDPSTEVLCMAYAFDDEDVHLWLPGQPFPDLTGCQIRAHNAAFERLVLWYVLEIDIPLEAFYCTATQARANCLPGSLEDVGRALSSQMRKDHRGNELVRKCCIPPFDTEALPELYDYCKQDIRAMRDISKSMRDLSPEELADYHVNERINDRGVLADVELCRAAMQYSNAETEELQSIVAEVTKGEILSVRSPKMREWVLLRLGEQARALMVVYKDGKKKHSIDKTVRANLLAFAEENPDEVPEDVAEVIACADDLWASSTAKFSRMATLADSEDGRIRGAFVFAGGSATGRASSYGAQVHNLPRKCAKLPEDVRRAMVRGHRIVPEFGKRTTDVLKSMLRPTLMAKPGHTLVALDWSAIEGRVNPWLAHSALGEAKLDVFRSGRDPYIVNAAATYNRKYEDILADHEAGNSAQRQVGKVQELALGFSGGVGAFASMGKNYGLIVSETEAKGMVNGWRKANPWAMQFWCALEEGYLRAMRNSGQPFTVGRVTYLRHGAHLWYSLPSGRVLCYPFAKFNDDGEVEYLKAAWKPAAGATEWPRARLWRGLGCENIVQATANDLLRHALREMDRAGLRVVLHVHDEIVVECKETDADTVRAQMAQIMTTPPAWATGLPLNVDGKVMRRFGK